MSRVFAPGWLLIICLLAIWVVPRTAGALEGGLGVTLDQAPQGVVVGVPFTVSFTVHSEEAGAPQPGLAPLVMVENPASDQRVTVAARPGSAQGHYVARVILPSAGEWQWAIYPAGEGGAAPVTMPPLVVGEPGTAGRPPSATSWLLGFVVLALLPLVGLAVARRWASAVGTPVRAGR